MSSDDAEAGIESVIADRTYTAVFHDVWVAALAATGTLRGWSITASDPRAGTVSLVTADLLGRAPATADIRLSLDEVGLTRLELRTSASPPDHARDRRRARRLLRRIDRLLQAPPPG